MSKPNFVIARATVALREPGSKYPTSVRAGSFWWADSPMVREHPDLFADAPPEAEILPRNWKPSYQAEVEQATAAPGEKRATKRAN